MISHYQEWPLKNQKKYEGKKTAEQEAGSDKNQDLASTLAPRSTPRTEHCISVNIWRPWDRWNIQGPKEEWKATEPWKNKRPLKQG